MSNILKWNKPNSTNITYGLVGAIVLGFKLVVMVGGLNRGVDLVDESFNYLLLNYPHQYLLFTYTTLICGIVPATWLSHIWVLRLLYLVMELFSTILLLWSVRKYLQYHFPDDSLPFSSGVAVILFFSLALFNGRIENYINYHTVTCHIVNIIWSGLLITTVYRNWLARIVMGAAIFALVFILFVLKVQSGMFMLLLSSLFIYWHIRSLKSVIFSCLTGALISGMLLLCIQPMGLWKIQFATFFDYAKAIGYLSSRFPIQYLKYDLLPFGITLFCGWVGHRLTNRYGVWVGVAAFFIFGILLGIFTYPSTHIPFSYFLMVYAAFPFFKNLMLAERDVQLYAGGLLVTPFLISFCKSSFMFEIAILSAPL